MNARTIFDRNLIKTIVLFLSIVGIIIGRLFYLQIYLNEDFFSRAQRNFTRTMLTSCLRGNIIDCNGVLLATNRAIINVYWQGTRNPSLTQEQRATITLIETINNKPFDALMMERIAQNEKRGKKQILLYDVSLDILSKIIEKFPDDKNIIIKSKVKRCYPQKKVASHIIGYISAIDVENIGKMGIEKIFESTLQGEQGKIVSMINATGKNLYKQEIKKALAGSDIKTTLDLSLQTIAENSFDDIQSGVLILMDPENGAIRALVSRPSFDPNIFLDPISQKDWGSLQENQPFLNRAFNACYPPGSIFKLVTISAALEKGVVTVNDHITCRGYTNFHGRCFRCAKREGHGMLSILEAVAKSCNILFFKIGKTIAINDLADYAHRFGLGQKTNIIFQEKEGLVPSREWKLKTKGESWWTGETVVAAIGQSYLLTTPIQIACMISSIFKGYLVRPRILEHETISTKPLLIAPATRSFLKKCMKSVITEGTGIQLNNMRDIKIYGKTSTAETCHETKQTLGQQYREHAWFTAYFNYKNEKPLVLVLLIEHGGNARIATAIVKQFIKEYRTIMREKELPESFQQATLNSYENNEHEIAQEPLSEEPVRGEGLRSNRLEPYER